MTATPTALARRVRVFLCGCLIRPEAFAQLHQHAGQLTALAVAFKA